MKRFWKKRWLPLPVLIPLLLYAAAAVWTSTRNVSQLPVLMYHHISEDVATDMVISPARFEAHGRPEGARLEQRYHPAAH